MPWSLLRRQGKPFSVPAVTEYRVLARGKPFTWLELKPLTGKHCVKIFEMRSCLNAVCSSRLIAPLGLSPDPAILEDCAGQAQKITSLSQQLHCQDSFACFLLADTEGYST